MRRLFLTIEALDDLHVGTGTGWGDIDALQARDRRGHPVAPASHLKGLLRELAEEWHAFDPTAMPQEAITTLFGRAGSDSGQLILTSAYLDKAQPTLIWGSTQINAQGTAQERSLRFIEFVPAGSRFHLQAALLPKGEPWQEHLSKLIARCYALGGGRNRGQGRVRWHLTERAASPLFQHFPQLPTADAIPDNYPCRLRLLLRALDPLCLPRTGHPGNLIDTENFIRGRTLRGSFVAACLDRNRTDWAEALLTETLSWGDALPLPEEEIEYESLPTLECLPIPLSIGTPKAAAPNAKLPWWANRVEHRYLGARAEIDQIRQEANSAEKLKRPKEGEFLYRPNPNTPWIRYQPQILERLHTQVPSARTQYQQALFSTELLAERTLFVTDLIVTEEEQAKTLHHIVTSLADEWLRIGRGGRPLQIEAACWLPLMPTGDPQAQKNEFTLLLTSDLIVRDGWGNFCERLDGKILAALAGLDPNNIQIEIARQFSEGVNLYGFNAMTGLPRLAQRAIKAGSVFAIKGQDAAQLYQRLASGKESMLGESPEEGFGRYRLDDLPQPSRPSSSLPPKLPQEHRAEQLCRQARLLLEQFAAKALASPSASQWGEWRSRIQAARTPEALEESFEMIEEASQKHGGKSWQAVVKDSAWKELREAVNKLPLSDAQLLLDYFIRWQRASAQLIGEKLPEQPL